MRLVCISDTHALNYTWTDIVPDGDVLIHAGDFTNNGELRDVGAFGEVTKKFPHKHKILIAGNHDWCCERMRPVVEDMLPHWTYLQDRSVTIDGIKFYGSPWQPWFCGWAFNVKNTTQRRDIWAQIPEDTDVLITHCAPYGTLDAVVERECISWVVQDKIVHTGCKPLRDRVAELNIKLHLFGHIHEGYGVVNTGRPYYANCSICDSSYFVRNKPIVLELIDNEIIEIDTP